MSGAPPIGTAAATSEDGRFVLFDADAAEPAPDEGPFDAWLAAMSERRLAVGWCESAPGRRRLRVVQATEATEATGPAGTAGEGEPAPEPLRRRLDLPSGRLCFAGLDEAFAARNAELHPGAFGDVLELEPGCYELELARAARPVGPSRGGEPAAEVPRLRRGDERIAALVRGGLPLALVSGLLVGAIAVAIGGWLSGSILAGRLAGWSLAGGAVLLAAWAIVVRTGAMPPVQRVIAARRALADASPDAILAVRRLGEADQSSGPADGATDAVTGGAGSAT